MKKHLMLTLSAGSSASYPLRFVDSFITRRDDMELTLYYVAPRGQGWAVDCRGACPEPKVLQAIERDKREQGGQSLDKARGWLLDRGWSEARVHARLAMGGCGTVCEIVQEGHKGLYDAVLLGRRGMSWLQEMVEDSVSHKMLWEEVSFPLWICRMPEAGRRNVLMLADGSEESLRMADHVGFMLADEPDHQVTVLHVREDQSRTEADIEDILARTVQAVTANGVESARVHPRVVSWSSVSGAALSLAEEHSFAVVAMGRRGARPGRFTRAVFGTSSANLLREVANVTLWISR